MAERRERDEYRGDVVYEEWRRGLPEDSVSDDRIDAGFYDGVDPDRLVAAECQRRDEAAAARRAQEQEEYERQAYYEEQARHEQAQSRTVTRDMALDAGHPEWEGLPYEG